MLLNELKKIFTWKMMVVLLIVNALCFYLLIEFHITYFPNGHPAKESFEVSQEIIEKYGLEMDEEEYVDFQQTYEKKIEQMDDYLANHDEYVAAGIGSYELFVIKNEEDSTWEYLFGDDTLGNYYWDIEARRYTMEWYDHGVSANEGWIDKELTAQQEQRTAALIEAKNFKYHTGEIMTNVKEVMKGIAITVMLNVIIILLPLYIRDHKQKITYLHYTAKKGRNIFKTKLLAGMITTFIVTTSLLIIYLAIYTLNDTAMFFDLPVAAFVDSPIWYDLTFFQYIVISIFAIYLLSYIAAFIAMGCSNLFYHYVSLLGIITPLMIGYISFASMPMIYRLLSIGYAKYWNPFLYGSLILISLLFVYFIWKREQKRDVLI